MSAKRNGRTSKLRVHRLNSPRRFRGPSCRDSAPGWRRSFADGASNPLRRTKRTSKPCRLRRLHNDRKVPWRVFFHRASFPLRDALPGRPRRRRCLPPEQAHRSVRITRLRCARAYAFSSSRAPCAGGFRDSGRHTRFPRVFAWRSGLARTCVPYRGSSRRGFARAREDVCRTWGTCPARGARPPASCGVRVLSRVE